MFVMSLVIIHVRLHMHISNEHLLLKYHPNDIQTVLRLVYKNGL